MTDFTATINAAHNQMIVDFVAKHDRWVGYSEIMRALDVAADDITDAVTAGVLSVRRRVFRDGVLLKGADALEVLGC